MNIQELATVVANKLPIKVIILNNRYLGMVRQWQDLFYKPELQLHQYGGPPDFVKLAEAYGAEGYRITSAADLRPVLEKALGTPTPPSSTWWWNGRKTCTPSCPPVRRSTKCCWCKGGGYAKTCAFRAG